MIHSHSCHWADFQTAWYKRWARELLQDKSHLEDHALYANKFWQNAVMAQALEERGLLRTGRRGLGFGVGQERLPALFAKYDVLVTATDQDFTTQKAGHWAKHELATGQQSLNQLGICPDKKFRQQVEYQPVDMTRIPKKLHGKYDFLWSNCALGHLGSIPAGLQFITDSLNCLKPGGWAVHTTELNILSNRRTVDDGDTVIFRARDMYRLQRQLVSRGYEVSPFVLTLGDDPRDKRVSLAPVFGNDYSKIQFRGHLLTQILLIIHKPENFPSGAVSKTGRRQRLGLYHSYRRNIRAIARYKKTDSVIRQILDSRKIPVSAIKLTPTKQRHQVEIPRGKTVRLRLDYHNQTNGALLGVSSPISAQPIVLATANPVNRVSSFRDKSWHSDNRPSAQLLQKSSAGAYGQVEYVPPRQDVSFELVLTAKGKAKGTYREDFCLVQELLGWLAGTDVRVDIKVV